MRKLSIGMIAGLALLGASLHAAAIVEFPFNDSGNTTTSTGTVSGITANLYTASGASLIPSDLHSALGTGVAGDIVGSPWFGIDRAFNASAGIAANTTTSALSGLQSWTFSGWYKPSATLVAGSAFFQTPGDNSFFNRGFAVRANDVNDLRIGIDATAVSTVTDKFDPIGSWIFFAVTYDGTLTSNNVKVYEGFRNDSEAVLALGAGTTADTKLMSTLTLNKGTPLASLGFSIGARLGSTDYGTLSNPSIIQSMPALFDNFRVDGANSGNGGALNLASIDAYRSADIAVVPEPATASLLALGSLAFLSRRRRC